MNSSFVLCISLLCDEISHNTLIICIVWLVCHARAAMRSTALACPVHTTQNINFSVVWFFIIQQLFIFLFSCLIQTIHFIASLFVLFDSDNSFNFILFVLYDSTNHTTDLCILYHLVDMNFGYIIQHIICCIVVWWCFSTTHLSILYQLFDTCFSQVIQHIIWNNIVSCCFHTTHWIIWS